MLKKTMVVCFLVAFFSALFIVPGAVNTASAAAEATPKVQVDPNAIPEGVEKAEWTSPDTSTARGLAIALAKMTKNPALGYKRFPPVFEALKPEHLELMQEAYVTVVRSNNNLINQTIALYHIAEAFGEYYNAMECIDEFNRKGYLPKETYRKYDFDLERFGGGMVYSESLNPQGKAILAPYMSEEAFQRVSDEYLDMMRKSNEADEEYNRKLKAGNDAFRAMLQHDK